MENKFIIIDGSSLAYRAFYALDFLITKQGMNTNAVYGFTRMFLNIIDKTKPSFIAVAFDKGKFTFRNDLYNQYKANRLTTPVELSEQFPLIKQIIEAFGVKSIEIENFEADDIIGTLAVKASEANYKIIIITGDKDALQLVNSKVEVWLTKKGITDIIKMDTTEVLKRYSVLPKKLIDIKGLSGDNSDNIPGVSGIGEKTAIKLIKKYETIENLFDNISMLTGKKLQENLYNNREIAILSKKLVTINCNVPLKFSIDDFQYKPDISKLKSIFINFEFKSLLNKIYKLFPAENTDEKNCANELPDVNIVTSRENIYYLYEKIITEGVFYFYPLIIGKIPNLEFKGVAFSLEGQSYYLQNNIDGWEIIIMLFANKTIKKITYNAKNIYSACLLLDYNFKGLSFDIMIAAYLLNPTNSVYSISEISKIYSVNTIQLELNSQTTTNYYGWAAIKIRELHKVLYKKLIEYDLINLYNNIEQPLIKILSEMEIVGIKIDVIKLKNMSYDIGIKIKLLLKEIYELVGVEFNVNSSKQLGMILFDILKLPIIKKNKTGYSTDIEVLHKLVGKHCIIDKLLNYRQLSKIKSTYLDGLESLIVSTTGKVHTSFNQTVTATGRLSSSDPNLQNVPIRTEIGSKIRELFIPSENYKYILSADYSQIELRILAHVSKDTNLINAFINNQDIHIRTASEVYGIDLNTVTQEMRLKAKAVNFGIIYGISDYGLSRDLKISRREAACYIKSYFLKYTGVKKFIEHTIKSARQNGYICTLFGRRRYLPYINSSNFNLRSFAERTAINTIIQGTAADIIKKAMIDIYNNLLKNCLKSRILLQVHDELVLEIKLEEAVLVTTIIQKAMENVLNMSVPLYVEIFRGNNWNKTKKEIY